MRKIIMFIGGIETQEYFTFQLKKAFENIGHEVFLFQLLEEETSFEDLCDFIDIGNTVMVTFNFHGLNQEDCFYLPQENFWDRYQIPCYNICLDHPFYYHKFIMATPKDYYHISIDLDHDNYMKRFFPHIKRGPFLPLAGTEIQNKPLKERSIDIVLTGNYTPPKNFNQHITRLNDDYTAFYYSIIDDLIAHPNLRMEEAFEKHLKLEMGDLSDEDLKLCMENMIFIDLYVRFHFRGLVVKTLAEAGFLVHVYGGGWNLLKCNSPQNIINGGPLDSKGCLEVIADSKISLNVMPWFKNGAHDRVFNSMLNGAVCLSDDSIWMREHLNDGHDLIFYSLADMNKLPLIVDELLSNPENMDSIRSQGYRTAKAYHSWDSRAQVLSNLIEL